MKRKVAIMLANLLICLSPVTSESFWLETHKKITDKAISAANLNLIIDEQTGFTNTLEIPVTVAPLTQPLKLKDWMMYGSQQEDEPLSALRYLNHFYNPLSGSGLNDAGLWGTFLSSYDWASDSRNEWQWQVARYNYYRSLTVTTDNERKIALAKSLRGIGQVTHLVQDLAVPAHTRNDGHNPDGFERYVDQNVNPLSFSSYEFAKSKVSVTPYAPKQFWDSDTYTLQNPNPSSNNTQGLAEYTNANFASEDTIFTENNLNDWNPLNDGHYFPRPARTDVVLYDEFLTHNETIGFDVYRRYFFKTNNDGEEIKHFAYAGRLYKYYISQATDWEKTLGLDDQCYNDYAQKLIPRAVGYSAGLLNYFFRGKVFMEKDPQNAGKYIIKNESNEKMEGIFALYYDDASENRNAVPGASWTLSINANTQSSSVTFTEPTSPAPKEKGKYTLVFNGKLGMEEGAVVGRVVTFTVECKMAISGPERVSLINRVGYSLSGAVGNVTWSVDNPGTRISGNNNGATLTIGPWGWWPPLFANACGFSDPKGHINITATDQVCSKTFVAQAGQWVVTYSDSLCGYRYNVDWWGGKYCTNDDGCLRLNEGILYGCRCESPELKGSCWKIEDGKAYYTHFASNYEEWFSGCITSFCSSNNPDATIPIYSQIDEWKCP